MTRNDWVVATRTMGKYRCIRNIENQNKGIPGTKAEYEHCLSGERGEIWEKGDGTYKAFIVLPTGSEKIYSFKSKDLYKQILRLKVPANPADQLYWANNPNARYHINK